MAEASEEDGVPKIINKETDPVLAEINQKIEEVLNIYDEDHNRTFDAREFGNVVRAFGCCPSEAELQDMMQEVEEEEPTGYLCFEKCQPMLARVLLEKRYKPASEEKLLQAFKVLDKDNKKHFTKEEIRELMTNHGVSFCERELEEMDKFAFDSDSGLLVYEDYIKILLPTSEELLY